jgi:hypothetical protein
MSKLGQVVRGRISRPVLILVYGPDGIGKSSFGSKAPNPIFFGPETGTDYLDVCRYPEPKNWKEVLEGLDDLIATPHDYKTLVVDSLDWIEPLLFTRIIADDAKNAKTIETACGGYGKGYIEAEKRWKDEFIERLNILRFRRKMNIILVAHSDVVNFPDPESQTEYKRYELKLHKRASAKFREYVDAVLFCTFRTFIKRDKDTDKVKTFGMGDRIMLTEKRPAYDAKNRYGLPHEIQLDWDDLVSEIEKGSPSSLPAIKARIEGQVSVIVDAELKKTVLATIEKAGDDVPALTKISERLAALQGEVIDKAETVEEEIPVVIGIE